MSNHLDSRIEGILFFKASPMRIKDIATILNVAESDIGNALKKLQEKLTDRGLQLVYKDDSVLLTTSELVASIIKKITQEDLQKDLGKAGLETLSIIIYRGPITRSEIDYIRGINSTYILRILLIRGLIERHLNPSDRRSHLYQPTFELLQYLGVSKIEDLPEYVDVRKQIEKFSGQQQKELKELM